MADIDNLMKQAVDELDRLLNARNVMGDAVTHGDVTVIPLVSFGFGFGGGGGSDPKGGGQGGGSGGGGGIKPIAVLILDRDGARVEPVRGAPTTVEALASLAGRVAESVGRGRKRGRADEAEGQPKE